MKLLTIALLCLFSLGSIAAQVPVPAQPNQKDLETSLADMTTRLLAANTSLDELNRSVLAQQSKVDDAQAALEKAAGGFGPFNWGQGTGGTDGPGLRAAVATQTAELNRIKAERVAMGGTVNSIAGSRTAAINDFANKKTAYQAAVNANAADKKKEAAALADLIDTMDKNLRKMDVRTSFQEFSSKVDQTDLALQRLSMAYDKSLVGAYLKDKIGSLLNSSAMCEVVKQCKPGVVAPNIKKDYINDLFPNTGNSTRSTYQKTSK